MNEIGYINVNELADIDLLPNLIKINLEREGCIIIKNFVFDKSYSEDFLRLASKIGTPISHNDKNTLIWDIRLNEMSKSKINTFSEHNHEAALHTDSQYRQYPEDYFGLMCIKKANCGGGKSYLFSLKQLNIELHKSDKGKKCWKILNDFEFPFVVPSIFTKEVSTEVEFSYGKIIQDNVIRYRYDTLMKGLELNPIYRTNERLFAIDFLHSILSNIEYLTTFDLYDNEIVFINNKTMLHGRSSFTDTKRHLIRIRMNK